MADLLHGGGSAEPGLGGRFPFARLGPSIAAGVVAGIVLVVAVVAAVGSWYRAAERSDAVLAQGGEVVAQGIHQAITEAEARLISTAGLLRASDGVTRSEFSLFAEDLGLSPGMGGIGYIALVSGQQLDEFIARAAAELPEYRVFELDNQGNRVPVGIRPDYYPVLWFEPEASFDRPHGFDSGSNSVRLAALTTAATGDRTIATPLLRLFSEEDEDGFLLYRRVVDPRTGVVEGFTLAPMDVSEMLADQVPGAIAETVTWEIVDVTDSTPVPAGPASGWVHQVVVAGRTWQLHVTAREGSSLTRVGEAPLVVLIGGVLVALSLGAVAYLLYRRSETNRVLHELQELTLAKDRFLASVSHELRTPLTGVLGYAELLRDNDDALSDKERQEMIKSVADQAFDLGNIIEDLLVSARAELDQLAIAKVAVSPQAQVAQVLEAYGVDLASRVKVVDQMPHPLEAWGDPGRVRQVIRNLINNACRHGGPHIEVRIDETEQTVKVDVADNGPPIPPGAAARIFEPYQRATVSVGQPDSVGIGLSIARTLARLMGGDVIYTREGSWNVFHLTLPAVTSDAPVVLAHQSDAQASV